MTDEEMIAWLEQHACGLRHNAESLPPGLSRGHVAIPSAIAARLAELSALADADALTIAHLAAHHSRDEEVRKLTAERDAARTALAELSAERDNLRAERQHWSADSELCAVHLREVMRERDAARAEAVEARAAILYALQLGDEDRRFFLNRWWDGEGPEIGNEYSWDGTGPGWPEFLAEFRAALAGGRDDA